MDTNLIKEIISLLEIEKEEWSGDSMEEGINYSINTIKEKYKNDLKEKSVWEIAGEQVRKDFEASGLLEVLCEVADEKKRR